MRERARLRSAGMKAARVVHSINAINLRRIDFALDYGRLMGVRFAVRATLDMASRLAETITSVVS